MQKLLGTGLLVGMLALGASDAHASHLNLVGGCSLTATDNPFYSAGTKSGEIDIAAVAYYDDLVRRSTTITCYVMVNGLVQPGTHVSATGIDVIVGVGVVTYDTNSADDEVLLCQQVDTDAATCADVTAFGWNSTTTPLICEVLYIAEPGFGPVIFFAEDFGCPPNS